MARSAPGTRTRPGGRCAGALLALASLLGCSGNGGGGASAPAAPPPPPAALAGAWTGTGPDGQPVYALVLANGPFRVMGNTALTSEDLPYANDPAALQYSGTLTLAGTTLTGTATLFLPPAIPPVPTPPVPMVVTGFGSASTIVLSFIPPGGVVFSVTLTPDTSADIPFPLASLEGSYAAPPSATTNAQQASLTVTANPGNANGLLFSGSESGGAVTGGLLTPLSPLTNLNAFSVSFTYTATGGAPVTFTGIGYARPANSGAGPTFIIMTDSGQQGFAGIFTP